MDYYSIVNQNRDKKNNLAPVHYEDFITRVTTKKKKIEFNRSMRSENIKIFRPNQRKKNGSCPKGHRQQQQHIIYIDFVNE